MADNIVRFAERQCKQCGASFTFEIGKGKARLHCGVKCRDAYRDAGQAARRRAHYAARGPLLPKPRKASSIRPDGYVMVPRPGHPMSSPKSGLCFEHRLVAYEAVGPDCPPCFWCGVGLGWGVAVIDHLNEVRHDNSPGNLAVSCSPCNRARGSLIPFIGRMRPERIESLIATFTAMVAAHNRR